MAKLLVDKYSPKRFSQIVGNKKAKLEIKEWVKKIIRGEHVKPLFIYGEPGTGKTTVAKVIAEEVGWELVKIDALDIRDNEEIKKILEGTNISSLTGIKKLILIDDIDGIKLDKGRASSVIKNIAETIKNAKIPIIITGIDAWDRNLSSLRSVCQLVKFNRLSRTQIEPYLREIAEKEKINNNELNEIIETSGGDLRAALNSMQAKIFGIREQKHNMFEILRKFFYAKTIKEARDQLYDVDFNLLEFWIEEVVANYYNNKEKALQLLANSSLFNKRTKSSWKLLKYRIDLLSAVPIYRDGPIRISYPAYLRKRSSKIAERRELAKELAKKMHCSERKARLELDLLVKSSKD